MPGGVIIARTDRMNSFYGNFFPDLYIHYEYTSEIIEKILYRQETMIEKSEKKKKEGKKVDPRAFLVMDDCLSDKKTWMKDKPIMEIFFDGRHYQLTFILTMQYPLGIGPDLRSNFDYIFILADDFKSNQKRIYEHYAGMFPSLNAFQQVLSKLTTNYGSMVIVNRGDRHNLQDKIFYYKAPDEYLDKVGCRQFNKIHKNNYDENWRKKGKDFDINDIIKKKKNETSFKVLKV